jgi:hypothetical protein
MNFSMQVFETSSSNFLNLEMMSNGAWEAWA